MEGSSIRCRTCLSMVEETRNVFKKIRVAGEPIRLADILEACFDYKVPEEEDEFTQEICLKCVYQLTSAHSFKVLIKDSLEKLKEITIDKQEVESDHDESEDFQPDYSDSEYEDNKPILAKDVSTYSVPVEFKVKKEIKEESTPQTLYCVVCKKRFGNSTDLSKHCNKSHKPKNKSGRNCEYCNEKFEDFRELIIHRKYHFNPYLCQKCWIGFDTDDKMEAHTCRDKMVPRPRMKPTDKIMKQCHVCGKSYPSGYIKIHMLIHGEGTYKCKYCPKTFKVPCSLNSHVAWNHKRERNHKCNYCGASFITASSKSAHIRKHHLKEKNHSCETCGKQFFSKSEMQRHNVTHTGVRNFHCQHCDKSYQTRYGLSVHMKSHTSQYTNL